MYVTLYNIQNTLICMYKLYTYKYTNILYIFERYTHILNIQNYIDIYMLNILNILNILKYT